MALETAAYIDGLVASNPPAADPVTQADDHLRLIKAVLKNTFPNLSGPVTATAIQINSEKSTGTVVDWWGALVDLPAHYGLCDGSTYAKLDGSGSIVSPNLINRFRLGAGGSVTLGAFGGTLGPTITTSAAGGHTPAGVNGAAGGHDHGAATGSHALTIAETPAHSHSPTGGDAYATYKLGDPAGTGLAIGSGLPIRISETATSSIGGGVGHTHTIAAVADHMHVFTGTAVADHTHTLPLPAYMALWPVIHL
jgi:hypothetical protein